MFLGNLRNRVTHISLAPIGCTRNNGFTQVVQEYVYLIIPINETAIAHLKSTICNVSRHIFTCSGTLCCLEKSKEWERFYLRRISAALFVHLNSLQMCFTSALFKIDAFVSLIETVVRCN